MGTIVKRNVVSAADRKKGLYYVDKSGNLCRASFKRKRKTAAKKKTIK